MADLILSAFLRTNFSRRRLIWVSSRDFELLTHKFTGLCDVESRPYHDPIEELIAASDLVITKGNRGATLDAECVGVPSISLSPCKNPVDDILVPRMRGNVALNANAIDPEGLGALIERVVSTAPLAVRLERYQDVADEAARLILTFIEHDERSNGLDEREYSGVSF
jgi:UDP-N-acetylglucosamine:LPS N-acetylglucosamine transferase